MKVRRHGEHLVELTRFARVFPVSAYLVREEDGFTLVDAGIGRSERGILEAARGLGAAIRRIALTHAHVDHVGSLGALCEALDGVELLVPHREARFLAGDLSLDAVEAERGKLRGGWKAAGVRPSRELAAGDMVGSLEVVASPGHTPGHVSYLDRRDRTLVAGDAFATRAGTAVAGVMRPLFPFPALATWDGRTALESARALRALEPSRLAVGHGPVLEGPIGEMDAAIREAEGRLGTGDLTGVA